MLLLCCEAPRLTEAQALELEKQFAVVFDFWVMKGTIISRGRGKRADF